jgi:hypothetical protein
MRRVRHDLRLATPWVLNGRVRRAAGLSQTNKEEPMERGPIPLNVHAALEPLIAAVIVAAPWIFGFSDVNSATWVCVVVGVVMLLAGSMTDWRMSLMRVISIRTHFMTDLVLAAVLILSPFIFGFSDDGGATLFTIIAGVLEAIAAISTRWDPVEAEEYHTRSTPGARTR